MDERDDDYDTEPATLYVVNHDAMYWRARAINAERELAILQKKYDESVDTGMALAQTSSRNLLTAICAGAFDNVRAEAKPEDG